MPVNRGHAFANAPTYDLTIAPRTGWAFPIWQKIIRRLQRALLDEQIRVARASFQASAQYGPNCRIGADAWCVNFGSASQIQLGQSVICRGLLRIESFQAGQITIGDHVYLGDDSVLSCANRIEIGPATLLSHGVQIFDNDSHPIDADLRERDYKTIFNESSVPRAAIGSAPVVIGPRVWIGFNSIVLKGVTIGEGAIVGAGSVVANSVPPYAVVVGNPARVVKSSVEAGRL
jgi:acetyltransferase-like isoleucine patch superfamily enzyme